MEIKRILPDDRYVKIKYTKENDDAITQSINELYDKQYDEQKSKKSFGLSISQMEFLYKSKIVVLYVIILFTASVILCFIKSISKDIFDLLPAAIGCVILFCPYTYLKKIFSHNAIHKNINVSSSYNENVENKYQKYGEVLALVNDLDKYRNDDISFSLQGNILRITIKTKDETIEHEIILTGRIPESSFIITTNSDADWIVQ